VLTAPLPCVLVTAPEDGTALPVSVAVTGQTVVYSITVVVVWPMRAGQSVTVAAQEVMVYTDVVVSVLVTYSIGEVVEEAAAGEDVVIG